MRPGEEFFCMGIAADDLPVEERGEGDLRDGGKEACGRRGIDFFGGEDVTDDLRFESHNLEQGLLWAMLAEEEAVV